MTVSQGILRTSRVLGPVLSAIFASQAGFAQVPMEAGTGTRVLAPKAADIGSKSADPEGIALIREFARCTYGTNKVAVARAVALDPGEDTKALTSLAIGECLNTGQMAFSGQLLRGALYSELVRQKEVARSPWMLTISPFDPALPPPAEVSNAVRRNFFMLDLASCVYAREPVAARDLIIQPYGSAGYAAALKKLIPQLGPCAPQGMTLKINRMSIEHALAEYIYRAQPAAPASTGGPS